MSLITVGVETGISVELRSSELRPLTLGVLENRVLRAPGSEGDEEYCIEESCLRCALHINLDVQNVNTLIIRNYYKLAVPGHALLWLSLVEWKRKKRESARF